MAWSAHRLHAPEDCRDYRIVRKQAAAGTPELRRGSGFAGSPWSLTGVSGPLVASPPNSGDLRGRAADRGSVTRPLPACAGAQVRPTASISAAHSSPKSSIQNRTAIPSTCSCDATGPLDDRRRSPSADRRDLGSVARKNTNCRANCSSSSSKLFAFRQLLQHRQRLQHRFVPHHAAPDIAVAHLA